MVVKGYYEIVAIRFADKGGGFPRSLIMREFAGLHVQIKISNKGVRSPHLILL